MGKNIDETADTGLFWSAVTVAQFKLPTPTDQFCSSPAESFFGKGQFPEGWYLDGMDAIWFQWVGDTRWAFNVGGILIGPLWEAPVRIVLSWREAAIAWRKWQVEVYGRGNNKQQ